MVISPPLLIALGFGLAAYGTLIGAGGAIVLIPALILLYPDFNPTTLTSISLAIVFINALSGTMAYSRLRRIDYKTGSAFAVATIPGTIAGIMVSNLISTRLFSIIFGIVLIMLSILLMLRPQKQASSAQSLPGGTSIRILTDAAGDTYRYSFNMLVGILISFGVGFLAGLLGIGGGIIHVPVMVFLMNFPVHIATATSHFILVFTSLTGSLTHVFGGAYHDTWQLIIWLAIGVIPGAQIGAWLSKKVRGILLIRLLSIGLALMGIRLILLAF